MGAGPCWGRGLTVAVRLIRAVLAVRLAITAQPQVHALTPRTGELSGRAYWAALLIALVVTLGEAVTAPGPGDAVDLPSSAGELVGGARGRLCGAEKDHHGPPAFSRKSWAKHVWVSERGIRSVHTCCLHCPVCLPTSSPK